MPKAIVRQESAKKAAVHKSSQPQESGKYDPRIPAVTSARSIIIAYVILDIDKKINLNGSNSN